MHPFPHHYAVTATLHKTGDLMLFTEGGSVIESAPPKEFDGPGNQWSPETLLTAAVADCFALSFRAIATASKFAWTSLSVKTEGPSTASMARPALSVSPPTPPCTCRPTRTPNAAGSCWKKPRRSASSATR